MVLQTTQRQTNSLSTSSRKTFRLSSEKQPCGVVPVGAARCQQVLVGVKLDYVDGCSVRFELCDRLPLSQVPQLTETRGDRTDFSDHCKHQRHSRRQVETQTAEASFIFY